MTLKKVILITLLVLIAGCSTCIYLQRPYNYTDAYIIKKKDTTYLKLKGKRQLMVHDPISLILSKTYTDSTLIPLPYIKNIIHGGDIPVEKGYYKYKGTITIDGNKVKVNLYYDDYDSKILESDDWDGSYQLVNYTLQNNN